MYAYHCDIYIIMYYINPYFVGDSPSDLVWGVEGSMHSPLKLVSAPLQF